MVKFKSFAILTCFINLSLISSCNKDENNNTNITKDSFGCSSYTLYKGNSLNDLKIDQKTSLTYNEQGKLAMKITEMYDNNVLMGTTNCEYTYLPNMVKEKTYLKYMGNIYNSEIIYYSLNNNNLLTFDSAIDQTNPSSVRVTKRMYDNDNHTIFFYLHDTTNDGTKYTWANHNLSNEYLKGGGPNPLFLIMSHTYGNKQNTINLGDFWNNGMKSYNLPEKSVEPNYEYNYTYKIENDGFVSECITAVSSPGGAPYRYEKAVYTR